MTWFDTIRHVHLIGVGGISMQALAILCARRGLRVSGSDTNEAGLRELRAAGADVYCGSRPEYAERADVVVYTAAIAADDPERLAAERAHVPCIERKLLLARFADECASSIAIAGTHGKTTVSAMTVHIFRCAGIGFVGHIGGNFADGTPNWTDSGKDWFVTEACEYHRSLLELSPTIGVVLNCEFDHPDTYKDLEDLRRTFCRFLEQSRVRIVCESIRDLAGDGAVVFGKGAKCDSRAGDLSERNGKYDWTWTYRGRSMPIRMPIAGLHNVTNALAAATACAEAGLDMETIRAGLETFGGVSRRMECVGRTDRGVRVITDYAHHPAEIACAIDTARRMTKGNLIVLFEPHTYSRTKALAQEFCDSLYWADTVGILPTYAARERPSDGMDATQLHAMLHTRKIGSVMLDDYAKAADFVSLAASGTDLVLALGAGSIDRLARSLVDVNT